MKTGRNEGLAMALRSCSLYFAASPNSPVCSSSSAESISKHLALILPYLHIVSNSRTMRLDSTVNPFGADFVGIVILQGAGRLWSLGEM